MWSTFVGIIIFWHHKTFLMAPVVTEVTKYTGSSNAASSHWLSSAAEWGQTLLHRHKKEPVHWQEHKGHLPRLHRQTGLYCHNFFLCYFTANAILVQFSIVALTLSLPHFGLLYWLNHQRWWDSFLFLPHFFLPTFVFHYFFIALNHSN